MNKFKSFFALLASGIIFGTFGIWIRLLNKELTTYQQITTRSFIGFFFAVIIAFLLKQRLSLNKVNKLHLFGYLFFSPLDGIFFVLAMLNTKIVTAIFAFYASALLSSFFIGKIFFKEKITSVKFFSLLLTVLGLFLLSYPFSLVNFNLGFLFGIISGFFDTGVNVFRKLLSGKVERFVLAGMQMFVVAVVTLLLMGVINQALPVNISISTLIVVLIFGFLLMSISFLTLVGFQNFDLNLGTIVISSELVFAPIFAAIAFREYPTIKEILGGFLIAFSILVPNLSFFKKK
ncbi:MAG: DMT family transporter [Patescibacteria group bacterium]|nr:DMT family transporter [Patescibacteria group bacterium]